LVGPAFKEDRMTAIIFDLAEERARRRSRVPEPPSQLPDLNWRLSQRGNPDVVVNDAFHIVVFRREGWSFRIEKSGDRADLVLGAPV
jgi:hypothetical protein